MAEVFDGFVSPEGGPEGAGGAGLSPEWREAVERLTRGAVDGVEVDARRGDGMSVLGRVHVELAPGGGVQESRLVCGAQVRRSLAHRKMRLSPSSAPPRVLLFAGDIAVRAGEPRLVALAKQLELEDKALELWLLRVLSHRPAALLVEGAVPHLLVQRLCAHGVALAHHVPLEVLRRVARVTGAELLTSTRLAHADLSSGRDPAGTAGSLRVEQLRDDAEHPSTARPGGILGAQLSADSQYIVLDGCDPRLGCTVLLRGGSRAMLAAVKAVLELSILLAYHLQLEAALYRDRGVLLPLGAAPREAPDSDEEQEPPGEEDRPPPLSLSFGVQRGARRVQGITGEAHKAQEVNKGTHGCSGHSTKTN